MFLAVVLCFWTVATDQSVTIAPGIAGATEPQGAFCSDGNMIVAFGTKDTVYVSKQTESGVFESPSLKLSAPGLMIGMHRGPRVAVNGETVVVTYALPTPNVKFKSDLYSITSKDGGKTWGAKVRVNDVEGSAPEGLDGLCAMGDQKFASVWLDHRNTRTEIRSAVTSNGGKSWDKNVKVYESPGGTVCECCHPSVCADARGTMTVMWRNSLAGNRDMYASRSKDGQEFEPAVQVGRDHWKLDACPMDGGAMTVGREGTVSTIWQRNNQVFFCRVGDTEHLIGVGSNPTMVVSTKAIWIAWVSKRGGELYAQRAGDQLNRRLGGGADDPHLFADSKGKVAVVWTTPAGPKAMLLAQ